MSIYVKQLGFIVCGLFIFVSGRTQGNEPVLSVVKKIEYTPVTNQAKTGTCWSFSTTSLIESQTTKNGFGNLISLKCLP